MDRVDRRAVYRVLDANANRAREGLRVVEEVARFALSRGDLTQAVKRCRHQLAQALEVLEGGLLLEAREAGDDVGAGTLLASEERRENWTGLVAANLKRVQEAARVLEEYAKLAGKPGEPFKEVRFTAYALEKEMGRALEAWRKAPVVRSWHVYVVTGEKFSLGRPTAEVVRQALAGGADVIQLREKDWATKDLVRSGLELRRLTREAGAALIVNDRIDVALAVEADGAHIGQKDMPASLARQILGPRRILGISAETVEEAVQAERDGADYLGLGPIFPTTTKTDTGAPGGLELIRKVRARVKIPIVAIGGIKGHNAAAVISAGADSVAVVTEVVGAEDIAAAARALREAVRLAREERE
ncbi:MAG TPA: thiamine phosphate synthase [Firmicutes bacterium]|nr:thiamine phosphate synthase [Bacillota bacterium]